MDCLFCKIINNEVPSYKIYEDDIVIAFLDINPESNGHTLIVPKEHYQDLDTIDNDTLMYIMKIAKRLKDVLYKKLNCSGMTLIQNNGLVQEVKHFHLHLIPSYEVKKEKLDPKEIYEIITKN